jgi:hypothetical protein
VVRRIWRHIVTVEDAERGGCDLFDIANLRPHQVRGRFQQPLYVPFVDDALAVFPLSVCSGALCDSNAWRKDFKAFAQRPFGYKRVWVGLPQPYRRQGRAGGAGPAR